VSWLRALTIIKGVGPKSAERAVETIVSSDDPSAALARAALGARGGSESGLKRLAELLGSLRGEGKSPPDQISEALEYYIPIMREAYPDDFPRRERDLEHFQNLTARYRSLESMLADMALEPPSDAIDGVLAADAEDEFITLSTIHSAKGLEWKVVFIIWAADGRFPSPQSVDAEEIEEERRLMYVAVTRARDELYISYPIFMFDRAFGHTMGRVSRFLEDIPPAILPTASLQEGGDAPD